MFWKKIIEKFEKVECISEAKLINQRIASV